MGIETTSQCTLTLAVVVHTDTRAEAKTLIHHMHRFARWSPYVHMLMTAPAIAADLAADCPKIIDQFCSVHNLPSTIGNAA